ncbi:MAG: iron-sulfur cluster assembly protein [Candidatus Thorarchaeota archaeon]
MKTDEVMNVLRRVLDPEHPVNVVEMGLVKEDDVIIKGDEIQVQFAPTVPQCPMGAVIGIVIRKALEDKFPNNKVSVQVKPGTHMREEACNTMINNDEQYQNAIEKLNASGALDRLIVNE